MHTFGASDVMIRIRARCLLYKSIKPLYAFLYIKKKKKKYFRRTWVTTPEILRFLRVLTKRAGKESTLGPAPTKVTCSLHTCHMKYHMTSTLTDLTCHSITNKRLSLVNFVLCTIQSEDEYLLAAVNLISFLNTNQSSNISKYWGLL